MRFLRAFGIGAITAIAGCVLAFFVGDYLTRLLHVSDFEGQRAYAVVFLCAPLGMLIGFVIGVITSFRFKEPGIGGFLLVQVISLIATCVVAGLVAGMAYLLSDKPPRIEGRGIELQFEVRVPPGIEIPKDPNGYYIQVALYTDNRQSRYAFIDWQSIVKAPDAITIPGKVPLLTHSRSRSLMVSVGNEPQASQFIELKLPPSPRKEDEAWSEWIVATERADLTPVPEPERFSVRYRVQPAAE